MKTDLKFTIACGLMAAAVAAAPVAAQSLSGDDFLYADPSQAAKVAPDAYSSATAAMEGNAAGNLPAEQVKARILEFLKGSGDYREMYVLATSYKDSPVASAIELVLDPKTMCLYATSEKQTEKLFQMFANPNVSAMHVRQLTPDEIKAGKNYFAVSEGVQIFGRAKILKGGDAGFDDALRLYMPTLTKKPLDDATLQRMRASTIVVVIEPTKMVLVDGALLRAKMNYKQVWVPDNRK